MPIRGTHIASAFIGSKSCQRRRCRDVLGKQEKMKKAEVTIKNKLLSNLILSIGGILFTLIGIYLLSNPNEMDKGGLPNWILGTLFLPFGLISFFRLLDFIQLKIREDELEIISLFRKRIIPKSNIVSYGIENYKGKHVSGERIRIFCKNGSYKFHTTQLESIDEIKKFVKEKEVQSNAFVREKIGNIVAILACILLVISPVLYEKFTSSKEGEIQAIGIPANFNKDINIVEEKGSEIKFELEEYQGYLFIVDKSKTPQNMKTTKKELVIFIEDKDYAQELTNKETHKNNTPNPRLIPVDEITILE